MAPFSSLEARNGWRESITSDYVTDQALAYTDNKLPHNKPFFLWVYYGFPVVIGLALGPFAAGILALTLCDSAFEAEVFRGGIQSIEQGQLEAADSIGLNYYQKMRLVILPQAIRRMLPPLGNQFVYMLKMSSLVSVIGLQELTRRANELTVSVYRPLEIYSVLVAEYLLLILVASWLVRRLEDRMRV